MTRRGDTASTNAGNTDIDDKTDTDTDDLLFASKGGAAPAPARGDRPAIFLVPDHAATEVAADELAGDDERSDLFEAEKDEPDTDIRSGSAPAASLDAKPFDPGQRTEIQFEDAPVKEPDEKAANENDTSADDVRAEPKTARRSRLLTPILVGAAAAAAIAAIVTAFNWYQFTKSPDTPIAASAPAATKDASSKAAVPDLAAPMAAPPAEAIDAVEPAGATQKAPVIDLVRLDPDGATIIAGRAAPGTALLILDNDKAIGSVVAGDTGDWVLIPERPLSGGEHEIALAIKGEDAVSISTPEAPSNASPQPRPAAGMRYVVQVASVKTEDGAKQEWRKLKASLPGLLDSLEPHFDAAQLPDRGTFHRIRLGPFEDRDKARSLCAALVKAGKDCLVVRRQAGQRGPE